MLQIIKIFIRRQKISLLIKWYFRIFHLFKTFKRIASSAGEGNIVEAPEERKMYSSYGVNNFHFDIDCIEAGIWAYKQY